MRLRFTKMQGAGNDFVVLDATRAAAGAEHRAVPRAGRPPLRRRRRPDPGRRAAAHAGRRLPLPHLQRQRRRGRALRQRRALLRALRARARADRQAPHRASRPSTACSSCSCATTAASPSTWARRSSTHARMPFDCPTAWRRGAVGDFELWPLELIDASVEVAVLSMGNPHAVQRVDDVDAAPVAALGPADRGHARFPQQGQRRLHAGDLAHAHRAARVRARRRRDAGLRHRRLRRGGGRHPAGLAGRARRGRHARRAPAASNGPAAASRC